MGDNSGKSRTTRRALDRRAFLRASASTLATVGLGGQVFAPRIANAALKVEKEDLKFGFIKLTDMAPIAIAKEKGFFEDEGLFVAVEAAGELEGPARPRDHRRTRRRPHARWSAARRYHRLLAPRRT